MYYQCDCGNDMATNSIIDTATTTTEAKTTTEILNFIRISDVGFTISDVMDHILDLCHGDDL
jgi:hypothetical protein